MKLNRKFSVWLFLLLILLIGQAIFAQTVTVKSGATFTLKPDETATTADGKLKVRLKGVGRTISESGETEYAELQIIFSGSTRKIVISERGNRTKKIGGYTIELVNAESFGRANCRLKISAQKMKRRQKK